MCTADEPEDILAHSSIAYTVSTNKFFKSDDGKQESFLLLLLSDGSYEPTFSEHKCNFDEGRGRGIYDGIY